MPTLIISSFSNFLLILGIFACGLPVWADLFIFAIVFYICRGNAAGKFLISISLLTGITLFSILVIDENNTTARTWDRDHERWSRGKVYEKNVDDVIHMKFGDLLWGAVNQKQDYRDELIKTPRTVRFVTDKYGFRNDPDHAIENANVILVGDSFVVANGISQKDTPAVLLSAKSQLKVASMAHPGAPQDYFDLIKDYSKFTRADARFIIFFFEGNDFGGGVPSYNQCDHKVLAEVYSKYERAELLKDQLFSVIFQHHKTFILKIRNRVHYINARYLKPCGSTNGFVRYIKLKGQWLGFFEPYISASTQQYEGPLHLDVPLNIKNKISAFVFIPTKFRVYQEAVHFLDVRLGNLPSKFKESSLQLGIPVIDLSVCLKEKAVELLPKDKYVFWRDDTHWSPEGIEAAMTCLSKFLKFSEITPNKLTLN